MKQLCYILFLIQFLFFSCISSKSLVIAEEDDNFQYLLEGEGNYTIILETGLGDDMETWQPIFSDLTKISRTFAYNRNGYGKTSIDNLSSDAASIAKNLHTHLEKINIPKPYVLVGHSLGGQYSMAFAKLYPNEVAGILFLDARHPKFTKWCKEENAGNCEVPSIIKLLWREHTKKEYEEAQVNNLDQLNDLSFLHNIPISVLAKDKSMGIESRNFKELWYKSQELLANESKNGKLLEVKNSTHYIHKDKPEMVLKELKALIQAN